MATNNTFTDIRTEARDQVLRIEINRPQKKNSLTIVRYAAMAEEMEYFTERLGSAECEEALSAFFERCKPDFFSFK